MEFTSHPPVAASAELPSGKAYRNHTAITGPARPARAREKVRFRPVLSFRERFILSILTVATAGSGLIFLGWLVQPDHVPDGNGASAATLIVARAAFVILVLIEVVRVGQSAVLWVFASRAADPVPVEPQPGLRVAVLTTIVPSKEPLRVVARTLRAMKQLRHDGVVDVWILDEGDDPVVKSAARALGVRHFSRKGRPEYNQPAGPHKAKTKAGNHNAWRVEHDLDYDVVVQMDPDHVPLPCMLERLLGYFRDPDVAFVVAPQVYGNQEEAFVARASAAQAYVFHGVLQRGGNGLGAPLLIGTNHAYRPKAWDDVGGYQDSIIEDHLTSMAVHATTNPDTGNRWRGVYTPDILSVGEGPTSWTDYFNQQKRWAYGIWEIMLRRAGAIFRRLDRPQQVAHALLHLFYPGVAFMWFGGALLTGLYLLTGITAVDMELDTWGALWGASAVTQVALFRWLRRFNLTAQERKASVVPGMLLAIATTPVYASAALSAVLRRPLAYAVTAKGDMASPDRLSTFRPHLVWSVAMGAALAASVPLGHDFLTLRFWAAFTIGVCVGPVAAFLLVRRAEARERGKQVIDLRDRIREDAVLLPVTARVDR